MKFFAGHLLIIMFSIHACQVSVFAQNTIQGRVTDRKQKPVPYASIAIAGTYEGTVANDSGYFELKTSQTGTVRIAVSSVGLQTAYADVVPGNPPLILNFELKDEYASVSPAVITAGTFSAGDKSKAEIFKPRDIGTTAGTPGDIQATIESLPGTQKVGYTEGLFVRGGSGRESKYIMDGLIIPDPYYSNVPSIKQHGRIDPFLFSGTTFSAGGYSAQYGQALSSVLILNSRGLADSTKSGGGIHTYGGNVFHTQRWKNASLNANISYTDLSVYHRLANTRTDWIKSPQIRELRLVYRYKASKNSMLKLYGDISDTRTAIRFPQTESLNRINFRLGNLNYLINGTYTLFLKDNRSSFYAGASFSGNYDHMRFAEMPLFRSEEIAQAKLVFKNSFTKNIRQLTGMEYTGTFLNGRSDTLESSVKDHLMAFFTETDAAFYGKLAIRAGIRTELSYFSGNDFAPRISVAYKYSKASQLSFSYGTFFQQPDKMDMLYNPKGLISEKAVHYLFNYQFQLNDRTLRAEFFVKNYGRLVTGYSPQSVIKDNAGYARGFEIFYRDKTTISNIDWWISYSFCRSERKTILEGILITPDYISKHTLSLVCKYWFSAPGVLASASANYSSPKVYRYQKEPGSQSKLNIPARYELDISFSKPTVILHKPALIFLSWQNLTGFDKVLGYIRIPAMDDPLGVYRTEKRSLFFGIFISMYND